MSSKTYNKAGKTLVVDEVIELNKKTVRSSSAAYLLSRAKQASDNKQIEEDIKNKSNKVYELSASTRLLKRNDRSTGFQIIYLKAEIEGYPDANPRIVISDYPRICAWKSGDDKEDVIAELEDLIESGDPFTPDFTGENNWHRGGSLFSTGDTTSVIYFCSDGSYITAKLTISSVSDSSVTGTVYEYDTVAIGYDDRDPYNTVAYFKDKWLIPYTVSLYDNITLIDSFTFDLVDETGFRKVYGSSTTEKTSDFDEESQQWYIKGDSYVYVTSSGDTKTSVVKIFTGSEWANIDSVLKSEFPEHDAILADSLPAVFEQYSSSINHVQVNGYDWFKQVIGQYISGIVYYVGGCIYGGRVTVQKVGNTYRPTFNGKGFFLSADGEFIIQNATFNNCFVNDQLTFNENAEINHPALKTTTGSPSDNTGVTLAAPTGEWNVNALIQEIRADKVGLGTGSTYNGNAISRIENLMNSGKMYALYLRAYGDYEHTFTYSFTVPYDSYNCVIDVQGNAVYWQETDLIFKKTYYWVGGCSVKVDGTTIFQSDDVIHHHYSSLEDATMLYYNPGLNLRSGQVVSITINPAPIPEEHPRDYNWTDCQVTLASEDIRVSNVMAISNEISTAGDYQRAYTFNYYEIPQIVQNRLNINYGSPAKTFDSNNYCYATAILNYRSFGSTTLQTGVLYRLNTSRSMIINGQSTSGYSLMRNSDGSVTITFSNGVAIVFRSGESYYVSGSLAVKGSEAGVMTKGLYSNSEGGPYDVGSPTSPFKDAYIRDSITLNSKVLTQIANVYSGSSDPASSLGSNGDVYFKI